MPPVSGGHIDRKGTSMLFKLTPAQWAGIESLGVGALAAGITAELPTLGSGQPINWAATIAAGLVAGLLYLQRAFRDTAAAPEPPK